MATKKKVEAEAPAENPVVIKSIKGMDGDMRCRGYQFALGQTYTHAGSVGACSGGFHACPVDQHPLSVFEYYPPAGSRFFEVSQGGNRDAQGTKLASATITIDFEITIGEIVKRAWDWVWERATKSDEAHVTIDYGAASSTGYQGAASSTGTRGAASSTGTRGAASSTGDYGAASSTGDYGAASSTGYQGAAMASGYDGKVMGADGNALFAVERDGNYKIMSVASGIVGLDGIEPNTWYACKGGKLTPA